MEDDFPPDRRQCPTLVPSAKYLPSGAPNSASAPAGFRMTIHATRPYDAFRAAGWTDVQLLEYGYMSRAGEMTRPTQLGDLPICADSIDRLDKALSDRDEAYSRELSRLREIAGPKLYAAYRELAGLKVLRRLLDTQEGATLKAKLCALNKMLDPEDEPYDY